MTLWPPEFQLDGDSISIVPSNAGHAADLAAVIEAGALDKLWYTMIPPPSEIGAEIERRLALRASGNMLPMTIISKTTNKAVGMTTYMNIDAANRRLEIGSTFFCKSVQRSAVNSECKLLLLRHAFEHLDCIAVEFRTHCMNLQSRRAIERLGAKFDGILRAHMIMANGTIRDTAVYSILASEWPTIKANLNWQLEKPR
ncbi:GNAT family N-acetyltransferase [Alphaproteobacteria bacterium]|nr:GNAT family N-acetyltransferase [Alphaproteobacteria bacterium]